MQFGKVLRNTAMASAVAVLAFGAGSAYAGTGGDGATTLVGGVFQAHVGASVLGTTAMVEHDPISFGNIAIPTPAGGVDNFVMDTAGVRSAPSANGSGLALLHGTYGGQDTIYGAAKPGSYTITGDSGAKIYLSYFVDGGAGTPVSVTNANPIVLSGPGAGTLKVYHLTDTANAIIPGDIYAGDATRYLTLTGGTASFTMGGTIEDDGAGPYPDGPYRGQFDIMVHY